MVKCLIQGQKLNVLSIMTCWVVGPLLLKGFNYYLTLLIVFKHGLSSWTPSRLFQESICQFCLHLECNRKIATL